MYLRKKMLTSFQTQDSKFYSCYIKRGTVSSHLKIAFSGNFDELFMVEIFS